MPLYEYECLKCHRKAEYLQRFGDTGKTKCEHCGGELKKLLSAPMVQFKGTGWYVTDYGAKKPAASRSEAKGSTTATNGQGASTGDSGKAADDGDKKSGPKASGDD